MQLQLFLYFVRYRIIPANIDQQTLSYLRPVAENLVAKGQFKPTVLEMFAATD
jgi:hypothetical protein